MKTTTYTIGNAIVQMETPKIKTTFWFAENDRSTEDNAKTWAHVESCENENYFIAENMRQLKVTSYLEKLDSIKWAFYTYEGKDFVECVYSFDKPSYANAHKLEGEELEQLRHVCVAEQERFVKRLKNYLKRYGLSKCTFDTYWSER